MKLFLPRVVYRNQFQSRRKSQRTVRSGSYLEWPTLSTAGSRGEGIEIEDVYRTFAQYGVSLRLVLRYKTRRVNR